MRLFFLPFVMLLVLLSCTEQQKPSNKFSDPIFVKIYDFQDRRMTDSLVQFFESDNSSYRRDAVLAFASIQDTSSIETLGAMLNDPDKEVRVAAAFALGQSGNSAVTTLLFKALSSESDESVTNELLEAIGKVISKDNLAGFLSKDLLPSEGLAWCFYRLGLRGMADSSVVKKAIPLLDEHNDNNIRLGIAHFFARGPSKIDVAGSALIKSAERDTLPEVRMASVSALRKVKSDSVFFALRSILKSDLDYRVRINAVRALQSFADSFDAIYQALEDTNLQVQIAASEALLVRAAKANLNSIIESARNAKSWRVQSNLYEAAIKTSNGKELTEEVLTLYRQVENPYAKAGLLNALGKSTHALTFVAEQLDSSIPVVKSTAASALVSVNRHSDFQSSMQQEISTAYINALKTNDPAVIGTIASALMDTTLKYKTIFTDFSFLYEARKALSLPKDNEALQPLEAAIAYFEGKQSSSEVTNEFNHPIDWKLIKSIKKDQQVKIVTSKGEIILQLLVEEAPGSVANFASLINDRYFDGKNFHRVVPNFVIQGGCNRGDGWGSEDYSIRSEFSLRRYSEGSVGMASAGKDTEGTQWFITHSPTPHLDGRYTIFATVLNGMDVIHAIEVGDLIEKAELVSAKSK